MSRSGGSEDPVDTRGGGDGPGGVVAEGWSFADVGDEHRGGAAEVIVEHGGVVCDGARDDAEAFIEGDLVVSGSRKRGLMVAVLGMVAGAVISWMWMGPWSYVGLSGCGILVGWGDPGDGKLRLLLIVLFVVFAVGGVGRVPEYDGGGS